MDTGECSLGAHLDLNGVIEFLNMASMKTLYSIYIIMILGPLVCHDFIKDLKLCCIPCTGHDDTDFLALFSKLDLYIILLGIMIKPLQLLKIVVRICECYAPFMHLQSSYRKLLL